MSFSEIHRAFLGARYKNEDQWRRARLIGWEIAYKNVKNRKSLQEYMQIGDDEPTHTPMTQEELDEIWRKYGKIGTRAESKDNG